MIPPKFPPNREGNWISKNKRELLEVAEIGDGQRKMERQSMRKSVTQSSVTVWKLLMTDCDQIKRVKNDTRLIFNINSLFKNGHRAGILLHSF